MKGGVRDNDDPIARPSDYLGFEVPAGGFKHGHPVIQLDMDKQPRLPARLAPRGQLRPLGPQRGVVAVPGTDHRGIVKAGEDLPFKIIHQGGEVFWAVGPARASRK